MPKTLIEVEPEVLTLLLAWMLAKADGECEAVAIRICCRRLLISSTNPKVKKLCRKVLRINNDPLTVTALRAVMMQMEIDGYFGDRPDAK